MNTSTRSDTKSLILEQAIPLFAERGFNGVSMRDIAEAVGVRAPALYNHYRDKQSLYIAAISQAFASKSEMMFEALNHGGDARAQLESFIHCLCRLILEDEPFLRLLQREILDADETRLHRLAGEVFNEVFTAVRDRVKQINPEYDAHLVAISIFGLVKEHFEIGMLRRFMPGYQVKHEDPEQVARHVTTLLMNGICG